MLIPIEYGVPTDKCGIQLRLGIERGFFRDEGLDFSLRVVFGGPEIATAFDSGALQIGELGTPPGLTAIAKGARFKIIGSSVRRGAVQYLVVAPHINDFAGLAGARLGALSRGSCSYWFMRQILSHNGLDPDRDVTIVGLGARYPEVVDMIAAGELDGAIIAEPNVTIGEDRGIFRVWLGLNGVDYVPRMQWCIAVANTETLARDPGLVAAVLRGCRRSYRYAAAHPDEWAAFGAAHFGMSRSAMAACITREINDLHFDCEIDLEGLEAAITLQHGLGAIDHRLQIADIADLRFQELLAAA
jgi:ABC-type nitrate/sulfonate/bicarbonate transport system substrate-binding protein